VGFTRTTATASLPSTYLRASPMGCGPREKGDEQLGRPMKSMDYSDHVRYLSWWGTVRGRLLLHVISNRHVILHARFLIFFLSILFIFFALFLALFHVFLKVHKSSQWKTVVFKLHPAARDLATAWRSVPYAHTQQKRVCRCASIPINNTAEWQ
jgi:hypothetical protein